MAEQASFIKRAEELIATANAISATGKGILAADESNGTAGKRLANIGLENKEETRRDYRELLFRTKGLNEFIGGIILYDETIRQTSADGKTKLVDLIKEQNIIPGIKVDMGARPLYGTDNETVTQGMTNLADRCKEYYDMGARFSKWRAILNIRDSGAPSQLAIQQNAETLARYGAISQACGLVPIIEPEVVMGENATLERVAVVSERVQAAVVKALSDHHVMLEGCLLKPNMVRPGEKAPPATPEQVGKATVRVLQHTIPCALPGIMFLSGGMSEEYATECLNECNNPKNGKKPWSLSFSFGRALQASVLKAWQGKKENVAAAQAQLLLRAKSNSLAQQGLYNGEGKASAAALASNYVKNHVY